MNILSVLRPKSLMLAGSLLAMGIPVLAAPITGVVNIGGATAAVTAGAIDFYGPGAASGALCANPGLGTVGCFSATEPSTGNFANLPPTFAGVIKDLQGPPITGSISLTDFIVFNNLSNPVHFDLTSVIAGGAPNCSTVNGNAPNVQCTPYLPGNVVTPFIVTNSPDGTSASVFFNVRVNAYTGSIGTGFTPYIGTFSTPSSGSNIAAIVADFSQPGGQRVAAYSANFTPVAESGQVPEPGTVTLLGVGALAIAFGAYRRKRAS